MDKIIADLWAAVGPQVAAFIGSVAGLIAAWALLQLRAKLKVDTDTGLAGSLYRTIENGLGAALARQLTSGRLSATTIPATVVDETLDYVKANNAKAIAKLKQSDAALVDKIVARLPDAKAKVVEAAAKVRSAG